MLARVTVIAGLDQLGLRLYRRLCSEEATLNNWCTLIADCPQIYAETTRSLWKPAKC